MENFVDFYELLGVDIFANQKQIKNAYLEKIKQYHPDTYSGDKNQAEKITADINQAYATLSNAEQKKLYDEQNGFEEKRQTISKQKEKQEKKNQKNNNSKNQTNENNNTKKTSTEKQKKKTEKNKTKTKKDKTNSNNENVKSQKMMPNETKKDVKIEREKLLFDVAIIALLIILIVVLIFK